jgi:hypothetical protein
VESLSCHGETASLAAVRLNGGVVSSTKLVAACHEDTECDSRTGTPHARETWPAHWLPEERHEINARIAGVCDGGAAADDDLGVAPGGADVSARVLHTRRVNPVEYETVVFAEAVRFRAEQRGRCQ